MSLREAVISDQYGYGDFFHPFASIAAGKSREWPYTPPKGYWAYPYRMRFSESMPADVFEVNLYFDGVLIIEKVIISPASSGVLNAVPGHPIKRRMVLSVKNTDSIAHTFDMYMPIAVIDKQRWEEFLLDIRGDKYKVELTKETIDALADSIATKLERLLRMRR